MPSENWKLGMFDPEEGWVPVKLGNTFCRETERGVERIAIAPSASPIGWVRHLLDRLDGPFRFVYCLLGESGDRPPGYYSVPSDIGKQEIVQLLSDYADFFEVDGRHTLWIGSPREKATIIFDEHNLIYGYGPLDLWVESLRGSELVEGPVTVPFPHTHHRHDGMEPEFERLMRAYEWQIRPPFG